jgi:uncharacterized small protein (DUF1192 family)
MFEEMTARRARGQTLAELTREDLDLYGADELRERIEALQGEIARIEAVLERKEKGRSAADALFSKPG